MAICQTLEIRTKHKDNIYSEYIKISKNDFMLDDLNDLKFEIIQQLPSYTSIPGTEITLTGFDKDSWAEIDSNILKTDIDNHFELLLRRE